MGAVAGEWAQRVAEVERPEQFDHWMLSEQRRIFNLCYRLLEDRDEADSAAQDSFLKAYRALQHAGAPPVEDRAKWLTRIAVNTCLDRLRSRAWRFWKRRPNPDDEEFILAVTPDRAPSAEDRLFARQIERRLAEALRRLSPRQRAVFLLRHYEDRRLEEIAEILQLDLGTVKAHMARALKKLRELLRDLYGVQRTSRTFDRLN
jgi:RNA polymerase sigma-70 factor (ECF subfamily)